MRKQGKHFYGVLLKPNPFRGYLQWMLPVLPHTVRDFRVCQFKEHEQ